MHHALLIDEVLEVILDECLNWSHKERRYALRQLARCCKAWKDPALDRLWCRLDDAKPLLRLLPDCGMPQRGLYTHKDLYPDTDLTTFLSYAARVKGIMHRHFLGPLASSQSPGLILLPRLSSITLWFQGCDSDRCWMVSPALRHVEVNIGFVDDSATDVASRSDAVASYLDVAKSFAPDLQTLRLRGRMTDQLNSTVASMTHLTVLTVLTSDYLGMQTLAAIATFPALRELNFHASRGCCDEFRDALAPLKGPYFPSLSLLRMRSPGPLPRRYWSSFL
ncbi:hypothetical protein A0H81_06357 [Grifola frondosa]|uniref:F-box domain-containing protein n=1 Tax=Grifola frondosa TaxID=5627 RepID=A0A1C7M9T7_GRIFR|nr:hypothetical protein A0H81_06357 [Grifola frondosa]